jgi:prephenate dehydratase
MCALTAFQGEHGAYSEQAIFEHFGRGVETLPCESFDDVFNAVVEGKCDNGFIPVENSVAGSIHRNYDLLLQHPLVVVGEHATRVSHCLIGLPEAKLSDICKVISHPQALAQCERYLRSLKGVRTEPVYDTAGSVKLIQQAGDPCVAAIASRWAAELYHMNILVESIEDNPANYTRFQIIAREAQPAGENAKTSIVFALKNEAGALFRAMSVFALRNIDLTKIESRPLVGKPWEYFFYIDFVGAQSDLNVQHALANLEEFSNFLRVLGSYPRYGG